VASKAAAQKPEAGKPQTPKASDAPKEGLKSTEPAKEDKPAAPESKSYPIPPQ